VSELAKFLPYLDRSDVTELVFESGVAARAKQRGQLRPVTREPLSPKHILRLVHNTPLESMVPATEGAPAPVSTRIDGVEYLATLSRSGSALILRLRRRGVDTVPPEPEPEPEMTAAPRPVLPEEPAPEILGNAPTADYEARPAAADPASRPGEQQARRAPPQLSYRPPPEDSPVMGRGSAGICVAASSELRTLLEAARRQGASDVHVMSGEPSRFRCGGQMVAQTKPLSDEQAKALVMPLLDPRSQAQLDELGYADFACEVEGAGRLRVNVNRQRTGIKGCFRLIMDQPPSLETLGMPKELRAMLDYHQGLVVISGPSGAGKTTTLSALVDMFNAERPVHIITVEDPVEIVHPIKKAIVTQREVGAHTKSFHSALKGSLREDPDVIAIGELRDRETVEKALEAAETGHLVFATMSTPSGASTIDRLIDMFPPDDQSQVRATLAGALKFVVSQRLVGRADGNGQVAAVELLTGGMALWSLIRDDKLFQLPSLLQRGRAFGMIRIEDSLNALLAAGTISVEVAKQYADDERLIGMAATPGAQPSPPQTTRQKGPGRGFFNKKGS
jgi:twitching motility protein PilT